MCKTEGKQKSFKYPDLARELNTTSELKSDGDTNCICCVRYSHQRIVTGTRGPGNKRKSGCHRNYCLTEIGQYNKRSSG